MFRADCRAASTQQTWTFLVEAGRRRREKKKYEGGGGMTIAYNLHPNLFISNWLGAKAERAVKPSVLAL